MSETALTLARAIKVEHIEGTGIIDWEATLVNIAAALSAERQTVWDEINTPEMVDFMNGVQREAAHQRERWGTDHDAGKTDADWFWLIGYLTGKALHKPEKRLHHLIAAAAALANWHLYTLGKTNMRPGIEPPEQAQAERKG